MRSALHLAAERPGEALAAYEAALERSPNRLNGLYGAGRAAEQAGDSGKAERYYTTLVELTEPADTELEFRRHVETYLTEGTRPATAIPQCRVDPAMQSLA